jgi:phage terminase large subunit
MGDCNPSHRQHWILHRASLKRFEQLHRHNPSLFNQDTGEWTEQGKRTMNILGSLTGIRKLRGFEGKWVAAEGVVYEFSDVHRIARDKVPEIRRWYLSIDFGYTNPFVCQLWGVDADDRVYLWHEIYMTRRTVKAHVPAIQAMIGDRRIEAILADHDAEDRATLFENGLSTIPATKDIATGIQAVQERLKVQADGKPRLYICEGACVEYDTTLYREYPGDLHPCCTEHEFGVYAYPPSKEGKSDKEVPLDFYNHGMDAMRYLVATVNNVPTWRATLA